MDKHAAIINYLHLATKGLVNITENMATEVIRLVQQAPAKTAYVKLYQFNGITGTYVPMRGLPVTMGAINEVLQKLEGKQQVYQFYKWNCLDDKGAVVAEIFTTNCDLF